MKSTRSSISVFETLRWGGRCLLGLLLAGAIFEVALRAIEISPWWRVLPAVNAQFDRPDLNLGYAHRPGVTGLWICENRAFVRINAQGLRDRPRTQLPVPGTVRIAVTGDSITEAMQVPEHDLFTLRAERTLSRSGHPVEVLNFGLSGALPLQQLLFVSEKLSSMGIDAAVFVFDASDFLNNFVRNDRLLPAYVEDASGKLVIGHMFRNRRSQRWANRWIGRAFFWLVDHSRVIDALYIKVKFGFMQEEQGRATPTAVQSPCVAEHALLLKKQELWQDGEPHWAARRLARFLSDVPKYLHSKPAIFLLRGFGRPNSACPANVALRKQVVSEARAKIEAAGIAFVDLDMALLAKMDGDESGFDKLAGFGASLGHGHLNAGGHKMYAEVLADAIRLYFSLLLRHDTAVRTKQTPASGR